MKNRALVSRWRWFYTEIPPYSLLAAPTASEREGTSLLALFMAFSPPPFSLGETYFSVEASPSISPPAALLGIPSPPPQNRHTHARTHSRAGTKALKAALYVPPQLPAQPLLQRSPSKDAYSSAPKGPHCCQLVTGRHRDSRLTAPAKQEKWAQWGARGPALFLPPHVFLPTRNTFLSEAF